MTRTRTITTLILTVAALLTASQVAQAQNIKSMFQTARKVHAGISGNVRHNGSNFGANHGFTPVHHAKPYCAPRPVCPPKQYCPPRPPCPPPVVCPPRCVYCVYYLDCHNHWLHYGTYNSRFEASQAQRQLDFQGYRTYVKVKHISGFGGNPGGYPSGFPTH